MLRSCDIYITCSCKNTIGFVQSQQLLMCSRQFSRVRFGIELSYGIELRKYEEKERNYGKNYRSS